MNYLLIVARPRISCWQIAHLTYNTTMLPNYLDCPLRGSDSELLLVEGKSALSAVKQVRNHESQAILAMQGKVPNALKHSVEKIMSNDHCAELVKRLACGYGTTCNPSNLRFGKVCILSESDPDGEHALHLLCVLFQTFFKQLVDQQSIRIVRAPLYRLQKTFNLNSADDNTESDRIDWHNLYLWSEEEKRRYLKDSSTDNTGTLTQFKGLASLSKKELLTFVVRPATRKEEIVLPGPQP